MNTWNDGYPSGGNYWNDPNCPDSNYDGICDSPYVVDANNTDNWPLAGLFHTYDVFYFSPGNLTTPNTLTSVSNSTVTRFTVAWWVEHPEYRTIMIDVAGEPGYGFCALCIPKNMMPPSYTVTIDNGQTPVMHFNETLFDNGTHRWLYFGYMHSGHQIEIVPEFPSFAILSLFMIVQITATMVYSRKRRHAANKKH
ncbi:hypothetical protein MUO69_01065 [Candidatus Bathyarchaeota archaeon]|nr:hypothetical protein [Candidatus Bathyarchaeota archaeon]